MCSMTSRMTQNRVKTILVVILNITPLITQVQSRMTFTPHTEIHLNQANGLPYEDLEMMAVVESIKLKRKIDDDVEDRNTTMLNKDGKFVGQYSQRCRDSLLMTPVRAAKTLVLDDDLLETGGVTCHWEIMGSGKCIPEITCNNFTLAEPKPTMDNDQTTDPCQDDFLELQDGTLGWKRYCGNNGPQRAIASRDLRDIYMTLHLTHEAGLKNRTFKCEIRCGSGIVTHEDEHNEYKETNSMEMTPLPEVGDPLLNAACKCGRKEMSSGNNADAKRGELPWVAVFVQKHTRTPFCAGTVINDKFVLTAAHCFHGEFANVRENVQVLLHPYDLSTTESKTSNYSEMWEEVQQKDQEDKSYRVGISKYFIHPMFVRQTKDFDVALVLLDKVIEWKAIVHASPICVPDPGQYDQSQEGRTAVLSGWGRKADPSGGPDLHPIKSLRKQKVSVFKDSECLEFFDWQFTSRMMCVGHQKKNLQVKEEVVGGCSVLRDSGAALIAERGKSVWEQIGILSTPERCHNNNTTPGVYTNTRQVAQWIYYVSSLEKAVWCSG